MVTFGRVLLWTLVLLAPGGFLLVPVLAAASLPSRDGGPTTLRGRLGEWASDVRRSLARVLHIGSV